MTNTLLTHTDGDFTTTYTLDGNTLTEVVHNDANGDADVLERELTTAQLQYLKVSVDTDDWSSLGCFFHDEYRGLDLS